MRLLRYEKPMKLTEFEKEMHEKLQERGKVWWCHTTNQETRALNRIVKKGYATYNREFKYWQSTGAQPLGSAPHGLRNYWSK